VPVRSIEEPLPLGRAEVLREGPAGLIWAAGTMATEALRAADRLASEGGAELTVVDARFVKPLDRDLLASQLQPGSRVMTVEENALAGGFGSAVMEEVAALGMPGVVFERLGIPDSYQPHGSQEILHARLDLDVEGILRRARAFFRPAAPHHALVRPGIA
jgi:1-deoxy-D-xylulose-5-phosphate synthase